MSHLENLIAEYYDWKGYLVKRNIKVGKLGHGGWEMELDVIAFDPHSGHLIHIEPSIDAHSGHLIHIEPSIDAHSWTTREERFTKKFKAARKYIFTEIFTWLDSSMELEQMAVLISHPKGRDELAGGKIISIDELMAEIRQKVVECGIVAKNAIPEQYSLLRTLQLSHNGYYKTL